MSSAEWLFVHTVRDLDARSTAENADRYEILGIAPLLRKLILDDANSLALVVRRPRTHVPLEFRLPRFELTGPPAPPGFDLIVSFLRHEADHATPSAKLRDFVRQPIGWVDGKYWTIEQMVKHFAHVEGGVHFGHPTDAQDVLLADLIPATSVGAEKWTQTLALVGRSVVTALEPLVNDVLANPSSLDGAQSILLIAGDPSAEG